MSETQNDLPQWIADHINLYREDPEKAHMWDSSAAGGTVGVLPTLLLTAIGRKSGNAIALPLIYKKVAHGKYVIVASKGGAPVHPTWYLNLVAEPKCHINVGKDEFDVVARTASGAEREDYWAQLAEVYPPYIDYKKYAGDREIPVVVLEAKTG